MLQASGFLLNTVFCLTLIGAGVLYGILLQKYKIFPFELIREIYYFVKYRLKINIDNRPIIYGPYSIGIYSGKEPFCLQDNFVKNPVLTGKDVSDIYADFVADPFIVFSEKKYFMFFEALNRKTRKGEIAYAESADLIKWTYRNVVIKEKFHMSYPYVFEWQNEYYMIPESSEDRSVRLYKALSFPKKWQHIANLLPRYPYNDPSIFRYNNKWWMFVNAANNLYLFLSDELCFGWRAHPMSPVVEGDSRISRPAGRVVMVGDEIFRFAQDSSKYYGEKVLAIKITSLDEYNYAEKLMTDSPVVTKSGHGWNASGMHHVDLHKIGEKWIGVVDGHDSIIT